jgi:hypothetical protein
MKLGAECGYINPHTVMKTGTQPESALRRPHLLRLPRRTPLCPGWKAQLARLAEYVVELVCLASPAGLLRVGFLVVFLRVGCWPLMPEKQLLRRPARMALSSHTNTGC